MIGCVTWGLPVFLRGLGSLVLLEAYVCWCTCYVFMLFGKIVGELWFSSSVLVIRDFFPYLIRRSFFTVLDFSCSVLGSWFFYFCIRELDRQPISFYFVSLIWTLGSKWIYTLPTYVYFQTTNYQYNLLDWKKILVVRH